MKDNLHIMSFCKIDSKFCKIYATKSFFCVVHYFMACTQRSSPAVPNMILMLLSLVLSLSRLK